MARECDRHGVSDRSAAAIASAVLKDVGVGHEDDSSHVIDPSKIRRERKKRRKELQLDMPDTLTGLYFDGRKDKTKVQVKKGTKNYPSTVIEEHVTLVQETGSKYSYIGSLALSADTQNPLKKASLNFTKRKP